MRMFTAAPPAHRPLRALAPAALLAAVLVLAACAGEREAPRAAQPVLAQRPVQSGVSATAYPGEVRARLESVLAFRIGGALIERKVDVGDRVRRGQVLAVIDPRDVQAQVAAAQAQLAAAEAELGRARADQARFATLAEERLVSRSALDAVNAAAKAAEGQARAARASLALARNQSAYSQLRAPRDGVIARRDAEVGQVLAAGQPVFALAADGAREVVFAVPEGEADAFAPGQPLRIEAWARPDSHWSGRVREVSPAADPASRTYAVRATVDAPADALALGQSARIYRIDEARALAVPLSAVQRGPDGTSVWVVDPERREVRLRPVRTGPFGERSVPVLGGLKADELVVAAGGHLLREGQPVQPVDAQNRPLLPAGTAVADARER